MELVRIYTRHDVSLIILRTCLLARRIMRSLERSLRRCRAMPLVNFVTLFTLGECPVGKHQFNTNSHEYLVIKEE